ncbi:hypothetical protein [Catenuloplanes atrovinosus]|uniref:Uncharacterized protein n=1 Tax=Catenuloplanes atrovinosus TaxID=137266 RepID=A0AAE3YLR8_9ACTN|nr:hypothetical protein [Catenuloplanes atrovinosus]MDR7275855.1 hypothetical protein [Catenuloplanes atrovinosus]
MTIASALLIAAVVVAVRLIPSVRWKAVVYALPLPMTLALVASGAPVDARHLLGLVLLVGFFAVVTVLHHRWGLHILLADAAAVAAYLLIALPLAGLGRLSFPLVLACVCLLWAVVGARRPPVVPGDPPRRPHLGHVLLVVGAALLIAQLAGVLRAFAVTFPYSGVLVAVETRRTLPSFTRQFARASLAMVAFLSTYYLVQPFGAVPAAAAAWAAHLLVAAVLVATAGGHAAAGPDRDGPAPRPGVTPGTGPGR